MTVPSVRQSSCLHLYEEDFDILSTFRIRGELVGKYRFIVSLTTKDAS